ncbi:MAG TPA: DinB family protein [Gemmataceae bacterium]|jgi:hypothetical protein|nr:DinB family protein [Gemmataceae bacterium]
MQGTEAVRAALTSSQQLMGWYFGDLSDADLLVRPVPGANHIAWQMGHLIVAERGMVTGELPGTPYPELPAGFAEQHGKHTAAQDPPKGFGTKAAYLDLFNRVRQTTLGALTKLSDADLDKPTTGSMAKFAPKLGDLFLLLSNHDLMHGGQFSVVRRKLGKPVLF